jgi:hypothetical protein
MKMFRFTVTLVHLALIIAAILPGSAYGELVYACWDDVYVIDMARGELIGKIAVGARINDLEVTGDGSLLAASPKGLHFIDADRLEVRETKPLGILDSIEYDKAEDLLYVLHHPGDDPNESSGPHTLLKLSGRDCRELGRAGLEPWVFDIFLDPPGDFIYVTQMAGRSVKRFATENMKEHESLWFGDTGGWEGRMVLTRHLAFGKSGSPVYALEQSEEGKACIWSYRAENGEKQRNCLGRDTMVQGMVVSPDGSSIYLNGVYELVTAGTAGGEKRRTSLDCEHRWIAMGEGGSALYLTGTLGEKEGCVTMTDSTGSVVKVVKVPSPLNIIKVGPRREASAEEAKSPGRREMH